MKDGLRFALHCGGNDYCKATAEGEVESNEWYHCAGMWDGEKVRPYVNARFEAETPTPGEPRRAPVSASVGSNVSKGTGREGFFRGLVDEVAVFRRALSTEEVQILYKRGRRGMSLMADRRPAAEAFATAMALDADSAATSDAKLSTWGAYLSEFSSTGFRLTKARERLTHWQTAPSAKDPGEPTSEIETKPEQAAVQPKADTPAPAATTRMDQPVSPAHAPNLEAKRRQLAANGALPPDTYQAFKLFFEDDLDDVSNWEGRARTKVVNGIVEWRAGQYDDLKLRRKIPVENVVVEWCGAAYENGFTPVVGRYVVALGGWQNTAASWGLGVGSGRPLFPKRNVYKPGEFHIWRAERIGRVLSASVDKETLFKVDIPVEDSEATAQLSFNTYMGRLQIDWVRVWHAATLKDEPDQQTKPTRNASADKAAPEKRPMIGQEPKPSSAGVPPCRRC